MTVAIVLKPDFGATVTRGLARIVGTFLGLALSTALVHWLFGDIWTRVVLFGIATFATRAFGAANFGLSAVGVTALVVVLTSFSGTRPGDVIGARGLDTAIGGAVALVVYLAWPTWERSRTGPTLATMLDGYRRYFEAVIAAYSRSGGASPSALQTARMAARLGRTNAEASIARLRNEPLATADLERRADSILAHSHRFITSAMSLEAELLGDGVRVPRAEMDAFARDVVSALETLSEALRAGDRAPGVLPPLRRDQQALARALASAETSGETDSLVTLVAAETDRMTNSLDTIAHVLRNGSPKAGSQ